MRINRKRNEQRKTRIKEMRRREREDMMTISDPDNFCGCGNVCLPCIRYCIYCGRGNPRFSEAEFFKETGKTFAEHLQMCREKGHRGITKVLKETSDMTHCYCCGCKFRRQHAEEASMVT